MTRPSLVPARGLQSYYLNTKINQSPMNTNSILCPASLKRHLNGGDYVTEGMVGQQHSVAGALTPVL